MMKIKRSILVLIGGLVSVSLAAAFASGDPDGDRGVAQAVQRLADYLLVPAPWVVEAEASQNQAAPGNGEPALILVVVTDGRTGAAITNLTQSSFSVVFHASVPGSSCSFTNRIVGFGNVGTGAYQIAIGGGDDPDCTWAAGDYLGQVRLMRGQAVFKLSIR
jgi:hypothetical protein